LSYRGTFLEMLAVWKEFIEILGGRQMQPKDYADYTESLH